MKKLVVLSAVFALTAPAFAGNIVFDGTLAGTVLTLNYTGDDPLGLAVTVDPDGAVQVASYQAASTDSFFDVFIDYAHDNPGYVLGTGTPVADPAAAGVATLPAAVVSLCMGHLEAAHGAPVNQIAVLNLSAEAASVVVDADTLRGGCVDADGAMTTNLPLTIAQAACATCAGDADGDGWVTIDDYNLVAQGLIDGLGVNGDYYFEIGQLGAGYDCYDMDGDGWCTIDDYNILADNLITGLGINGDYYYECGQI
jgi:hypothetical protein